MVHQLPPPSAGLNELGEWFTANRESIASLVGEYYRARDETFSGYSGRWFDQFAARGDPWRMTGDDVVAVSTLSVTVPPEAAAAVLFGRADQLSDLLRRIPDGVELWTVPEAFVDEESAANGAWMLLRSLRGVGRMTTSKLLAVKRPHMLPVWDRRVDEYLSRNGGPWWLPLRSALVDAELRAAVCEATESAPAYVSLLRRLDVALWMAAGGTKRTPSAPPVEREDADDPSGGP